MKKIVFFFLSSAIQLYGFDAKQPPPGYFDIPVGGLTEQHFLGPLEQQNAQLMALRSQTYLNGLAGFQPQPLMGLALLVAAADAAETIEDAQVCVDLAELLRSHPFIAKTQSAKNKAVQYLCHAVKMNHPLALQRLCQLHGRKIRRDQAEAIVQDNDPARLILKTICANTSSHNPELVITAGKKFLEGDQNKGRKPDPLRALVVFCYLHQKFPASYLGPQALAELMINQNQNIFVVNKAVARHYLDIALSRGLPDATDQQLKTTIGKTVESQENYLGETVWNWFLTVFGYTPLY